jgi:hypothetical protein
MAIAPAAGADSLGPIRFENTPATYAVGNINGQFGWTKTGSYDVAVTAVAGAPVSGYGFGTQALRLSNSVTSGSFGDQTFSPGLKSAAGEGGARHFKASFEIGTVLSTLQTGLTLSVSPDEGSGGRMSYLRFVDEGSGVHVLFDDVTDSGPLPKEAEFNETDIGTLSRGAAHKVEFDIEFVPGPGNDIVKVFLDGTLAVTGTTWEDYYRFDPEQGGGNNLVPVTNRLLFREGGTAVGGNSGKGFLVDNVALSSEGAPGPTGSTGAAGATGTAGANGATGAEGKSASSGSSLALKRKMSITFPKANVTTSGANAKAQVRCNGSTLQRCIGTLTLKSQGTVQRAAYSVLKGKTVTVTVPLDSTLEEKLLSSAGGTVVRAVARTEQEAGRPFRTSGKLRFG